MTLIMLCGKKSCGKTSAAKFICGAMDTFRRYSFAGPLKRGVGEFFGLTMDQIYGDGRGVVDERYGVTPRRILQIFGTEILQKYIYEVIPELRDKIADRMFWVKQFKSWYKDCVTGNTNIMIDDGRFPHEATAIQDMGGVVVRIYRPSTDKLCGDHPSETEVDKIVPDYVINEEDLSELLGKITKIVVKLLIDKK